MYEGIFGEANTWRYGNPGLLCGNMIGTRWQEDMSVWQEPIILGDRGNFGTVQYNIDHMTNLKCLLDSLFGLKGLAVKNLYAGFGNLS
jgi:hypothetical protein